ncbi:Yop proteins translocation protein T [Gammaproteobacteria bacterium]
MDLIDAVVRLAFCLPRLSGAFLLMPFLARRLVPGLVRGGVLLSLALPLYPVIDGEFPTESLDAFHGFAITFKEVGLGLLFGFPFALWFWILEATGFFIDNQRGSTMASSLDPLFGSQLSPLAILLQQAFMVVFLTGGGLLICLRLIYDSFELWPVFALLPAPTPALPLYFLGLMDRLMEMTVLLAGPVIFSMFLAEFGLALISRFAPQLNVFVLAMPIKSALGLFVLILYLPFLFAQLRTQIMPTPGLLSELSAFFR